MPLPPDFPSEWLEAVRLWAEGVPDVTAVWVYGSRARGSHRRGSDLDLAIETAGVDAGDRLAAWFDRHDWPALQLPLGLALPTAPDLDLQWLDPESPGDIVCSGVQRDGVLLWKRS